MALVELERVVFYACFNTAPDYGIKYQRAGQNDGNEHYRIAQQKLGPDVQIAVVLFKVKVRHWLFLTRQTAPLACGRL